MRVKGEREIEAEIVSRFKAYELTRRQLGMVPTDLLRHVREASTLAETQFRNGAINAQLYLDAQSAYLDALGASQNAMLDAWRTLVDLNLLTGGFVEPLETKR